MHITYYRPPNPTVSFHLVAEHYVQELRHQGVTVQVRDLLFTPEWLKTTEPQDNSIAIVHPLFYFANWQGLTFPQIVETLQFRHRFIFGMEVADTTSISDRFVSWANHPGLTSLFLPSQFSMQAFKNSGVTTPLVLIPHGVGVDPTGGAQQAAPLQQGKFDFLKQEKIPKVLVFMLHEPFRKGWDLVERLIPQFPELLFVIRGPMKQGVNSITRQENILLIQEWLSEADLSSLYHNCDLLLSLHRGGAFELNCLEALASGLPVITTRYGSILDYLDDTNAHLVKVSKMVPLNPTGSDHNGLGATADLDDAKRVLEQLVAQLPKFKQQAALAGQKIREEFSWERMTTVLIDSMQQFM